MSTDSQTLLFLQRRLQAIETDIQDVTLMYIHAVSHKNMQMAERCEATLYSANKLYNTTKAEIQNLRN